MAQPHSSVQYVEPNSYDNISTFEEMITVNGEPFNKIINPEDYCIAFSITTSLCNRGFQVSDQNTSVTLNCEMTESGSKVNFMSGRLVEAVNHKEGIPYLTTDYADLYVTDLQDYGTTEMIGVKSVNIDFENAVLPVITIQFTDVRGMSLFTPKELSRLKNLPNSGEVTKDNVAQFFFQCFFKFPYPKFNISVKGFYGRAVSYEVTCDKFETNFNSETGNFDVTARFIGYRYSFLTDISLSLLEAAPYCDFLGKEYWDEKKQKDFQVTDINGQKVPMPTLIEIRSKIKDILTNGDSQQTETTLTDEENTHDEERRSLEQIKETYAAWYKQLINDCNAKYGNNHVFVKEIEGEYRRVIILIPSDYAAEDMSQDYLQMHETLKVNNDLYALIDKYNESYGEGNKLDQISKDFKVYQKTPLFNELSSYKKYNGLVEDCKIPKEVVKEMLLGSNKSSTIDVVFNNGQIPQYTYCFDINVDYHTIQTRINKLTEDSNKSYLEKRKEAKIRKNNKALMTKLGFNPTVSNVTKIIMAHLETLMHMIYNVTDDIKNDTNRTPNSWGITCGTGGTCPDIDCNATRIPPFPRVTKTVSENGIDKQEDMWIGELNKDSIKEADLVETFFTAIEEVHRLISDYDDKTEEEKQIRKDVENGIERCMVKYPTTTYDFFLNSKLYNDDVLEDINKLSGAISLRMFGVLCLNFYANQYSNNWKSKAEQLGRVEAHNFANSVRIESNPELRKWIKLDNGELNSDKVLSVITSNEGKYPWSYDSNSKAAKPLFDVSYWVSRYPCNNKYGYSYMYPAQRISFNTIKDNYNKFKKGEVLNDKDVLMSCPSVQINSLDVDSYNCHNNLIIEDDVNKVKNILDKSLSESVSAYSEVMKDMSYKLDDAVKGYYRNIFKHEGDTSFCKTLGYSKNGETPVVIYARSGSGFEVFVKDKKFQSGDVKGIEIKTYTGKQKDLTDYFDNQVAAKSITTYFISEIFDYDDKNVIDHNTSLLTRNDFSALQFLMGIDCIDYDSLRQGGRVNWLLRGGRAYNYYPRLVVLQLGAILANDYMISEDLNHKIDVNNLGYGTPGNLKQIIVQYLNNISIYSRIALIKFFQDWKDNEFKEIKSQLTGKNLNKNIAVKQEVKDTSKREEGSWGKITYGTKITRVLLYEKSDFVKKITNSLMLPVLVVNGNVNHFTCGNSDLEGGRLVLPKTLYLAKKGIFKNYLDGFIDELNQILGVDYERDENGNMVRRAREASNTSDEMRMELYRYLKQVYDKWIPSTKESDWNFKNFFDDEGGDGNYKFYFIDSYYNKIGDKLLINPAELLKRLDTARNNSDITSSVYSLLGWIYGDNRCMFKCIQNFLDFSDGNGIYDIFKPLPYTEAMKNKRQGSDFVVVYTYEPSKYLDISSSEYTDDGFMLNNEFETPVTIKSRGAKGDFYKIPAFGVTYGNQYQSYFKSISLDTKNAIQTQQAIFAKHAILQGKTSDNKFGLNGQDLFDIYTTQSYTCKVEMMGCAWVQPMMYFVLLNVPMFRGSYMIMKVNHRITPGNMTTTFTGCRMSNCANKFVENIFISSEGDETEHITDNNFTRDNDLANVDNDCPYAVYPIFNSNNASVSINDSQMTKAQNAMIYLQERGYTKEQAAGICGNIMKESGFNEFAVNNSSYAAGLCQWLPSYHLFMDMYENRYEEFGYWPKGDETGLSSKSEVRNLIKERDFNYQLRFAIDSIQYNKHSKFTDVDAKIKACKTVEEAVNAWLWGYEKPGNAEACQSQRNKYANDIYNASTTSSSEEEITKVNEDIYLAFFNAIKKTCENTSSMMFTPKSEIYNSNPKTLMISADNDSNNAKLSKLFDCILNTPEYFKYVTSLYWVYDNAPNTIVRVDVKLSNKAVPTNQQRVYWYNRGTRGSYVNKQIMYNKITVASLSEEAKRSLGKRYVTDGENNFKKMVQVISDPQNLNEYTPTKCADVSTNSQIGSEISKGDAGKIDGWDVGSACTYIISHEVGCRMVNGKTKCGHSKCASHVEDAIAAGGGPLSTRMQCGGSGYATNLRYRGILEKNGFVMIDSGTVEASGNVKIPLQSGDVAIIGKDAEKYGGKYHACMFTSRGWVSDFIQRNMNVYGSEWPYAIYRFHNKMKS